MPFFAGIMPFYYVMSFICFTNHESGANYDNVKLCTQFSCLCKKHLTHEIMLKRILLAAKQGNLKMHMRGVLVLLYKRAVSCKCIQITRSVENRIGSRLIPGIN